MAKRKRSYAGSVQRVIRVQAQILALDLIRGDDLLERRSAELATALLEDNYGGLELSEAAVGPAETAQRIRECQDLAALLIDASIRLLQQMDGDQLARFAHTGHTRLRVKLLAPGTIESDGSIG